MNDSFSFMSVKEFCEKFQVSTSTTYRMIKSGQIPAVKFGTKWKIPREILDNARKSMKFG